MERCWSATRPGGNTSEKVNRKPRKTSRRKTPRKPIPTRTAERQKSPKAHGRVSSFAAEKRYPQPEALTGKSKAAPVWRKFRDRETTLRRGSGPRSCLVQSSSAAKKTGNQRHST